MNESECKAISCSWRRARENECDQVTIRFGLSKFRQPITERSNAKLKQTKNASNTQLKTVLSR